MKNPTSTQTTATRGRPCLPAITESEMSDYVVTFLDANPESDMSQIKRGVAKLVGRANIHKLDLENVDISTSRFDKTIANLFSHRAIEDFILREPHPQHSNRFVFSIAA